MEGCSLSFAMGGGMTLVEFTTFNVTVGLFYILYVFYYRKTYALICN